VSAARKPSKERAQIFVVDDHAVVRKGLTHLINHEPDLEVSGEAAEASGALKLITAQQPALAIVDISLERRDGIELVKELRRFAPRVPILVLSMHEEWLYAERVARAGARGYVGKQEATGKLLQAIRCLIAGGTFFSGRASTQATAKRSSPLAKLSDRELEVFRLLGRGFRAKQIAAELGLSTKTVESHLSHVKEKLGIHDATKLLQYATLWRKN
jgi:DNA-binding NarL/FixJ family response regulator